MANLLTDGTSKWLREQMARGAPPRPTRLQRRPSDTGGDGSPALPAEPEPPEGVENKAAWVYLAAVRLATQDDVDDEVAEEVGQPLLSWRDLWAGPEIDITAFAPHVYPCEEV